MSRFSLLLPLLMLGSSLRAQVLVNEIFTDASDALEIVNVSASSVVIGGWRVEYGGLDTNLVWTAGSFTFPAGTTIASGEALTIRESSTAPLVAPGTQVFQTTGNINWATTGGGQTRGGACILVNGSNQAVDMVRWLGALPPQAFGGVFSGTVNPTTTAFGRQDLVDDDDASDWADEALNLGSLSASQQALFFGLLQVSLTTGGLGDLNWTVSSQNPPVPGGEIYNFVSFQTFIPTGSGPFFGIGFDAIPILLQPASAANPFHTFLDALGQWQLVLPAGIPPGLHVEVVSILLGPGLVDRVSNTVALTF